MTRISDACWKELASQRGRFYFEEANKYVGSGDARNALSTAQEGLRLTQGPFYIAVRDQLQDLVDRLTSPKE